MLIILYLNCLLINGMDKLIIVSNYCNVKNEKRLFHCKIISSKILEHVKRNILVIISLPNKYDAVKKVIQNLILLDKISIKFNLSYSLSYNGYHILSYVIDNSSTYLDDLVSSFSAIAMHNEKEKYIYLYNTVCSYLDKKFRENNYCDFKNDQCLENRQLKPPHHSMGCCYSFDYSRLFEPGFTKNSRLCKYLSCRTCSTKCISCKLFTCSYLRDKGIHFYTNELLLLDCFFNKKQKFVIKYNFFKTQNQIIEKLLCKDYWPFVLYYFMNKYKIS